MARKTSRAKDENSSPVCRTPSCLSESKQRERSDSDSPPTFPLQFAVVPRNRLKKIKKIESTVYDEDYRNYIHQISLGGKLGQNARRWALQASAKFVDLGRPTNEALKYALFYSH